MAPTIFKYNVESIVNSTSTNKLVDLMRFTSDPNPAVNSIFDFLPGLMIIIIFWFVIFLSLKLRGYSLLSSFTAANIANFVLVLLMYPLGIVSGQMLVISVFLVPISALLLFLMS